MCGQPRCRRGSRIAAKDTIEVAEILKAGLVGQKRDLVISAQQTCLHMFDTRAINQLRWNHTQMLPAGARHVLRRPTTALLPKRERLRRESRIVEVRTHPRKPGRRMPKACQSSPIEWSPDICGEQLPHQRGSDRGEAGRVVSATHRKIVKRLFGTRRSRLVQRALNRCRPSGRPAIGIGW